MRLKEVLAHLDRVLAEERVARTALEKLQESLLADVSESTETRWSTSARRQRHRLR